MSKITFPFSLAILIQPNAIVPVVLLGACNANLARVDHSSLSQQVLMEILLAQVEDSNELRRYPEELDDIRNWRGVTINHMDEVSKLS